MKRKDVGVSPLSITLERNCVLAAGTGIARKTENGAAKVLQDRAGRVPRNLRQTAQYNLWSDGKMIREKNLIREMNKINSEISGYFLKKKKRWKEECNVMGCENKPAHKLFLSKFNRTLWSCKKHRAGYGEEYREVN